MEDKKNYKEELNKVETKYKRLRKTVLIIILLILVIVLINISYKFIILRKTVDNNININVGSNYKLTRGSEKQIVTTYVKDGIIKAIYDNKDFEHHKLITLVEGNTFHQIIISEQDKTYSKFENENVVPVVNTVNLSSHFWATTDYKVTNISLLKEILKGRIEIKNVEYNGKKCYKIIDDTIYATVDKETFRILNDNGYDCKLEIGVVTDEDIKIPDLSEYEIRDVNN